jgi:hypothetical protein
VRAAVVIGGLVVILMLDVIASWRILRSEVHSRAQKLAWLLLIWLAPLLGSILALQISTERIVPAFRLLSRDPLNRDRTFLRTSAAVDPFDLGVSHASPYRDS